MPLWGVRSGKYGEREALALDRGLAVIGWDELPDLTGVESRDQLRALLLTTYPDDKPKTLSNWESQIWPFVRVMSKGEPIVLPLKQRSGFALGRINGPYSYAEHGGEWLHTRPVEWVREVPRSAFAQDVQSSFGAFLTVFQVYRNEAEQRVQAVMAGKPDPALSGSPLKVSQGTSEQPVSGVAVSEIDPIINIEQVAEDGIRYRIATVFKGHKLSALVGALLETEGYRAVVSPPGADGGVDILAGKGPLGFDPPRLVVQVKSQDSAVDVSVLRELQGVMRQFGAEQGLLVAWGGVTKVLAREAQRLFFEIRIWDSGDLVRALQQNYDQLSEDLKTDLPLKRVWALAEEG
jgi:restriction system protein